MDFDLRFTISILFWTCREHCCDFRTALKKRIKNKQSDLRNNKKNLRHCCGTEHILYEQVFVILAFWVISQVHTHTETQKSCRVNQVTYHRTIQSAESRQQPAFPRRSASQELGARHGAGTKGGYPSVVTKEKMDRMFTPTTKLPTAKYAYRTSTRRRFQHHAPLTQHTYGRGRCRGDLQAQFRGVEAVVGSTHCGILQPHV